MAGGVLGFVATSVTALVLGTTPVSQGADFTPMPPVPPALSDTGLATAPDTGGTAQAEAAGEHGTVAFTELFGDGEGGTERDTTDSGAGVSSKKHPTGIDISSHQHGASGSIDIPQTVSGGQSFAFVKATEGTHYINPQFRDDTIDFIEADVPVGFYHYARPSASGGAEQARLFVRVTGIDRGVKSFAPVLDIETDGGMGPDELIEWTHEFVDEIKRLTDRETMIYTYPNFWKDKMGDTTQFNHLPLWIASYAPSLKADAVPGGWEDWDFWQYTSSGRIPGYSGDIDVNVFNGTEDEMRDLYIGKTVDDGSDDDDDHDHDHDHDHDGSAVVKKTGFGSSGLGSSDLGSVSSSVFPEANLKAGAIRLGRAIAREFPEIKSIGGYRPYDPYPDHPSGKALDVMIPNYSTAAGKKLGDDIVKYILDNKDYFGLDYMIWEQQTIDTQGNKRPMEDRGSDTQNHYDHVHVLVTNAATDPGFTPVSRDSVEVDAPSLVETTETVRVRSPQVTETVTVTPSPSKSEKANKNGKPARATIRLAEAFD